MITDLQREEHRLEWENIVISFINQGWSKVHARRVADERIEDRYFGEIEDEEEEQN